MELPLLIYSILKQCWGERYVSLLTLSFIWYVKPYVICKFMALTWHTCQLKEPGKFEISLWYESRGSESCLPLNILRNTKLSCWHPKRARSEVILFVAEKLQFLIAIRVLSTISLYLNWHRNLINIDIKAY